MAPDRFGIRARLERRRRRWRIALTVVVAAVVIAGGWAVWGSPLLSVDTVTVAGHEHVDRERIKEAAEVPLGTPIFQMDLDSIAEGVESLLPVASADVSRQLPRTIEIRVQEREAVAWVLKGSTPWAVDAGGTVYRALKSRPKHLPELDVDLKDDRARGAAAQVAADLVAADDDLLAQVRTVSARSKDSVELDLSKGRRVVWGSVDEAEHKVATLTALLQIDAQRYDVSAPERPTTGK